MRRELEMDQNFVNQKDRSIIENFRQEIEGLN